MRPFVVILSTDGSPTCDCGNNIFQRYPSPRAGEQLYRCVLCGEAHVAQDIFMDGTLE